MNGKIGGAALVILGLGSGCGASSRGSAAALPGVAGMQGGWQPAIVSVSVKAYDEYGAPAAGAPVVISNGDGSVLSSTATADDGSLAGAVPAGGAVTLATSAPSTRSLQSAAGITGSAIHLVFGAPAPMALAPISVTIPSSVVGATFYELSYGCGDTWTGQAGTTLTIDVDDRCAASNVAVLGIARDASWNPLAWARADVAPGGVTALSSWRTDFVAVPVTLSSAPNAGSLTVDVAAWHQGMRYDIGGAQATVAAAGGAQFAMVIPGGSFADAMSWSAELDAADGSGSLVEKRTVALGGVTASLSDVLMPAPASLSIDATDAARPTVRWSSSVAADAAQVEGSWSAADQTVSSWQAIAAGNPQAMTAVALPDSLASSRIDASGSGWVGVDLYKVDGGFDAIVGTNGWTPEPLGGEYVLQHSWASQ